MIFPKPCAFKYPEEVNQHSGKNEGSTPVRVLFLNHTAKLGGGELALRAMIRHLDPARVQHAALLLADGPLAVQLAGDTTVHVLPLASTLLETRKDTLGSVGMKQLRTLGLLPGYLLRLRSLIRSLDVDLVHTNSLKADILGGLAARLAGKRVLWHVRDRIETDYLPARVVKVFRRLARLIPHAVIANSHATLETLHLPDAPAKRGARKPWLARVVHDGFDFATQPRQAPADDGIVRVGLVGRISPWKGQDIFLQAIQQIHAEFPEVRFQIIGAPLFGEEALEAELRANSAAWGLAHCVEFCGFVSRVQEHMATLSLVVHASTLDEPFGQVVIEGMAAGVAVIATRGGGVSEIVEDGVSGVLVPKKDPTALAAAMRKLLADPERRRELGTQGRRRVQEHFRIEATAQKATAAYQQLMSL